MLSINCGEMPKRAAVARSYVTMRLQPLILLIAVDVGDDRDVAQLLEHARRKRCQILQIVAAHRELILRVALPAADAKILGGLQETALPREFAPASGAAAR